MSHSTLSTLSTCACSGNGAVTNVSLFRGATVLLWRNSGTRRQTLRHRMQRKQVDLMLTWCWSMLTCFSFGFRYHPHPVLPLLTVHLHDGGIMMSNMMWHIVTFSYFNAETGTHDTKVCQVLSLPIPWCNQRRHMHQPPQWHQSLVTETFVVCGRLWSLLQFE